MTRVLVPGSAGVFSALGLLYSDHERTFVRPFQGDLMTTESAVVSKALQSLHAKALSEFDGAASGVRPSLRTFFDLRYRGQTSELRINLPEGGQIEPHQVRDEFEKEYRRTFGHDQANSAVIIVNIGCVVRSPAPRGSVAEIRKKAAKSTRTRQVYFSTKDGFVTTPVLLDRGALGGRAQNGPLLIEEYDSTTVVPLGWKASLTAAGSILLERQAI